MKKRIVMLLCIVLAFMFIGCADDTKKFEKSEGVMTYEQYAAALKNDEVVIETFIQAKQSWWDNKATIYTQDDKGAYFVYELPCTEDEYNNKLTIGAKIKVTGYKTEWSGEWEVASGAEWVLEDGTYIADAVDLTSKFGSEDLINYQNQKFCVKGATVVASKSGENDVPFLYSWDGSGSHDGNSDLYFNVKIGEQTYQFTVESYLCGNDTDVYAAVEGLKIGDVIDCEGFLYWYSGVNPHITSVTKK